MEPNIIERILNVKNIKEKESLMNLVNQEITKLIQKSNEDSFVLQAIVYFILLYNPTHSEWKNKEIAEFSKKLISFYEQGKDISTPILKLMDDNFKKPSSFKILINFCEKLEKEKAYLECSFKLLLLTKNICNLLFGIKNFLSINDEFLANQLEKIDFESPYSQVLVRNVIEKMIVLNKKLDTKEIKEIFKKQITDLKNYYRFLCPTCIQFQFIRYYKGQFTVICRNNHNYSDKIKNIDKLEFLKNFAIKCQNCKVNLEMFESNFICFQCDKFFCGKCSEEHKSQCIKFILCKLFKCSFVCREHNKNFISICSICEKNLCESCKNVHYHRIPDKDYYDIKNIVDENKNSVSNKSGTNPKNSILKRLIQSYEFFQNYYMIPYFFRQSIYFAVNDHNLKIKDSDFFFDSFYDNNFISYYSVLVKQMENGNMSSINILEEIRNKYKEIGIKINDNFNEKISSSLRVAISNSSRMIWHLYDFNSRLDTLKEIIRDNELKYGYMSQFERNINNLETKIDLYKAKILSIFATADKYKEGLKLLFDRHFANLIIKILIKKYHDYFKKIKLDLKIAQELIEYYQNNLDKKLKIKQKVQNQISNSNTNQNEEAKNEYNDIQEDKNEIKFITNIAKKNIILNPTQLNFILELFFYTKKKGNQIGHPNLEPENNINLINQEKGFERIDTILKDDTNAKNEDEDVSGLKNIITDKVKTKMVQIKNEIMNYFINLSTKKQLKIDEILNFMIKGKISEIWTNQPTFFKTMVNEIDNIIREECEIDLPSFKYNLGKLNECEEILNQLKDEKILENFSLDISTKEYDNLKYLIACEFDKEHLDEINCSKIKDLKNIDYSKLIKKVYKKTVVSKFPPIYTEHEYIELINHMVIPFIIDIESNNYKTLKNNLIKQFKETTIMLNIKKKVGKIFNKCQDFFYEEEINEDYINNVKNFCSDKKDGDYKDISKLDINVNSVIFYINTLIGEENIYWLENDKKKGKFSLTTLLYFYQNKLEEK